LARHSKSSPTATAIQAAVAAVLAADYAGATPF
jgi:hypothetical protein